MQLWPIVSEPFLLVFSALDAGYFSAGDAAVFDAAFVGPQLFLLLPLVVLLLFVALLYN